MTTPPSPDPRPSDTSPASDAGQLGDVVPGDPPVPITLWRLPRPPAGIILSAALAQRLAANYTTRGARVVDLTTDRTARSRQPAADQLVALVITSWPRRGAHAPGCPPHAERSDERTAHSGERSPDGVEHLSAAERSPLTERSGGAEGEQDAAEHFAEQPERSGERPGEQASGGSVAEHLAWCAGMLAERGCVAVVVTNVDIPDQLGTVVEAARASGLTYLQHIVVAHEIAYTDPRTPRARSPRAGQRQRRRSDGVHLRVHTDVLVFASDLAAHG